MAGRVTIARATVNAKQGKVIMNAAATPIESHYGSRTIRWDADTLHSVLLKLRSERKSIAGRYEMTDDGADTAGADCRGWAHHEPNSRSGRDAVTATGEAINHRIKRVAAGRHSKRRHNNQPINGSGACGSPEPNRNFREPVIPSRSVVRSVRPRSENVPGVFRMPFIANDENANAGIE
jgi:hypothetical protein